MNPVHLHLLLNHLPILAVIFGLLVLLSGIILKNPTIKYVGLAFFILAALLVVPANRTGEIAEDAVEKIPGISHQIIEAHEEATKPFFIGTLILGALALLTAWLERKNKGFATKLYVPLCLIACVLSFLAVKAGNSGGQIRRPDLRTDKNNIEIPMNTPMPPENEDKD
ncbi:MAG: hypothetical protein IPM92_13770 [Saprospiraceae bacterium]|nr:hypothetical protein [Saprospiraceae bacterium]